MPRLSLARALRAKNRAVRRVQDLRRRVEQYNAVQRGSDPGFDVPSALAELSNAQDYLVKVKSALSAANIPVQEKIFEAAELRGEAAWIRNLLEQQRWFVQQGKVQYQVSLNDLAERLKKVEASLEALQVDLDRHNAEITIDLPEEPAADEA